MIALVVGDTVGVRVVFAWSSCVLRERESWIIVEGLGLWIISSSELRGTVISLCSMTRKKRLKKTVAGCYFFRVKI